MLLPILREGTVDELTNILADGLASKNVSNIDLLSIIEWLCRFFLELRTWRTRWLLTSFQKLTKNNIGLPTTIDRGYRF